MPLSISNNEIENSLKIDAVRIKNYLLMILLRHVRRQQLNKVGAIDLYEERTFRILPRLETTANN